MGIFQRCDNLLSLILLLQLVESVFELVEISISATICESQNRESYNGVEMGNGGNGVGIQGIRVGMRGIGVGMWRTRVGMWGMQRIRAGNWGMGVEMQGIRLEMRGDGVEVGV